ncbi:MAG TPA: PAS domain-containing protein, partial [Ramlibacter sp.]
MELSSIYDTAPIGLAVLDTSLRYLRINKRLAAINGRSVEDHIGRTVAEVLPDLAPQAEQVLRRILETGEPLRDVEIRGVTPSMPGVERVWLEQFTPLRDESGTIVAISLVAEEITERRRLEMKVRDTQERLERAVEAARLVMWEWRVDTDELRLLLGDWSGGDGSMPRTRQEFFDLVHPDDRAHLERCLREHLSGRTGIYECEYRIRAGAASYRWALSKGRIAARDASGAPLLMTGFRQDVTAQKEASERLVASERQLRTYRDRLDIALEAGRMGVWEWRPGSGQAYWSPQVFDFVGLPRTPDGYADSAQFLELVHPDDRAAIDAQLARALDQGGDYEMQFRLRHPSGEEHWLLTRGRVLHEDGGASRLIGINLDITRQKALEETLREAEARRNEFLAMLGHELRNPLAPITNAVRLLEHHGLRD